MSESCRHQFVCVPGERGQYVCDLCKASAYYSMFRGGIVVHRKQKQRKERQSARPIGDHMLGQLDGTYRVMPKKGAP